VISRRAGWAWVACQFLLIAALVLAPTSPALHAPHKAGWIVFAFGLLIFVAAYAALADRVAFLNAKANIGGLHGTKMLQEARPA
jgi:bacteriorhodopsin